MNRLLEVKIGDKVTAGYYDNVVVRLQRPGESDVVSSAKGTTGSEQASPADAAAGRSLESGEADGDRTAATPVTSFDFF